MGKTLFDKIWNSHVIENIIDGPSVVYIDKHFIHEVTSPQAFNGIKNRGIKLFSNTNIVATADHNVPTENQHLPIKDELGRKQVEQLSKNCKEHHIEFYNLQDPNNGIVHVIGPELGITKPGMTIVCGDSHTSTHGAFGSIAFGIGTSEVEMVFASQCILQTKPKKMRINVGGELRKGVSSKDVILYIISRISTGGATGYFIEYAGEVFENMTMEDRMTVCNMSIEMGARGGLIAPDETTFAYMKNRPFAPKGKQWEEAMEYWKTLKSDNNSTFDKEVEFNGSHIEPMITYGTHPGLGEKITHKIPAEVKGESQESYLKSLNYMGFAPGEDILGKHIDYVFVGSCTNGRIKDLRDVAKIVKGRKKADHITAWLVPGSKKVEEQAYKEGIVDIFLQAGFKLRQPGCSACLGMNDDKVPAGKYSVSTSNRNFEGRQGPGSRTMLASPLTAAATAIEGKIADPRKFL